MILRRFRIQVVWRSVILAATIGAALFLAFRPGSLLAAAIIAVLAALQVGYLVRYIEKTNRDLTRLLDAIRYSDFSQSFTSDGRGPRFSELSNAISSVVDDFRKARAEKEEGYRYLETVMQHVGVGLMSIDRTGDVHLINTAAKRLLQTPHLRNVSALAHLSPALVEKLLSLQYGESDLVPVVIGDDELQLSIHATGFKIRDETFKLVSLQNIQGELDEAEAVAWRKLTRVLTHEIMNSVAPISSLASTASGLLDAVPDGDDDSITDVRGAVATIARRSQGLVRFVEEYRRLTKVPEPSLSTIRVDDLFESVARLFEKDALDRGVEIERSVHPATLEIVADRAQVDQVLINLVRNSLHAVSDTAEPAITLDAHIDRQSRAVLQVIDNGHGIVDEAMDKVFVPFFTTKKDGSGIGLALSREIMRRHGGGISVSSTPGQRTIFRLRF